jgi:hypothetical protein
MQLQLPFLYGQDFYDNSLRRAHILLRKAAMSQTTFEHVPLTRPAEQIRLLKLQPDTDVIRLNIQTYELAVCPEFVALSYEWGDGSEIHDIIIDGAVFKIRQNLRDALEHIRTLQADTSSTRLFEEDSPYLWIDAIAIDQANNTEKHHQVSMMGKIYRQASHVVAWLGLEQHGDNSALALKYLSTDPGMWNDYQKRPLYKVNITAERVAIEKLCNRSYFQRIWIVQECVLARKLHLVCGLHYCPWQYLHNFNTVLHHGLGSHPVDRLCYVKENFEQNWSDRSIQDAMSHILDVAVGRHCSRFQDRIYGLLGILQQSYQTTGMDVDYGASCEEVMIKTQEFLTSDPKDDNSSGYPFEIQKIFEPVASIDVQGKVAWYWQINEIMSKLDADVIKGFHSFETLHDEKVRALTFQTICWIVGGYGVDLFSPAEGSTPLNTTTMQTISLESRKNEELGNRNNRVFTMHSQYSIGIYTYCVCLTHRPREPYSLPEGYMMTESNSWVCRSLLETYSKHVRLLRTLRDTLKVPAEVSDLEEPSPLPIRIQWIVFSNLLAQCFLGKYSNGTRAARKARTDGFVRQIDREGKDLDTFLSDFLFDKYHMSVANTSDELPANALTSVEIEITNSNDADQSSESMKKILVASLYDYDRKPIRKRERRDICYV